MTKKSYWSRKIAEEIASSEGIELSADHWVVINAIRSFYSEYGVVPNNRMLANFMRQRFVFKISSIQLMKLFPGGLIRQAVKIAGVPSSGICM